MPHDLFGFEEEEFADLQWMPLAMRFRLDVSGFKLVLASWQILPFPERVKLLNLPFEGKHEQLLWAVYLKNALLAHGLEEPATLEQWIDPERIPSDVLEKLVTCGCESGEEMWMDFKPIQRYALCKLARGKRADRYLHPAFLEFKTNFPSQSKIL